MRTIKELIPYLFYFFGILWLIKCYLYGNEYDEQYEAETKILDNNHKLSNYLLCLFFIFNENDFEGATASRKKQMIIHNKLAYTAFIGMFIVLMLFILTYGY